jgi:predicted dehydrogenase
LKCALLASTLVAFRAESLRFVSISDDGWLFLLFWKVLLMTGLTCRWGILSTAAIAKKNWHSIANSGNGQLVAVASRSIEKAQRFIDDCQASVPVPQSVEAVGSYQQLLHRDNIDAVYIPLPTALRSEWVIQAANAGKHVMVEKPCGVSVADVQAMVDACEKNNVQFMDGVMFMHSARMPEIRKVLDDGASIGQIRRIAGQFSFCADDEWVRDNIRVTSNLEPAGCVGDLGWYTIRMALFVMNYQMPKQVRGQILNSVRRQDSPDAVPMEFQCELHFENGVSAVLYNSFRTNHQQWVHVSGTEGYLDVTDFVLPSLGNEAAFQVVRNDFVIDGCRFDMQHYPSRIAVREVSNNDPSAQETVLFRRFGELVLGGKPDPFWPDVSLKTQTISDAVLKSAQNGGEMLDL